MGEILNLLPWLETLKDWIPVALQVVGAFALIATMTKNKVDDKIGQILMDVINFLAANFGKSKNKEE